MREPEGWVRKAACRDEWDKNLFFPRIDDEAGIAEAQAVCQRCPARAACLTWALENGIQWGIWGGKSEKELRALQRQRSRA